MITPTTLTLSSAWNGQAAWKLRLAVDALRPCRPTNSKPVAGLNWNGWWVWIGTGGGFKLE
jgi:hypothetical protein